MNRFRISNATQRGEFFETHVLDHFDNNPQNLFTQIAYMQHSYTHNNSHYMKGYLAARDLVTGGTFLTSYYDVEELRKQHPGCIDGRLTVYNAWEKYVVECTLAVCRIIKQFEVTPDIVHEIAVAVMYEKFVDHHATDLYLKKTPVSTFILEHMENKSLLSSFVDNIKGELWYELPFCYTGEKG